MTQPSAEHIEALTPETFRKRLNSLTEAVRELKRLKAAFDTQHPEYKHELSRVPKTTREP